LSEANLSETSQHPSKGSYCFVNIDDLIVLAYNPEGSRIVSGYGKRMFRLCLKALSYSVDDYSAIKAIEIMRELQRKEIRVKTTEECPYKGTGMECKKCDLNTQCDIAVFAEG